MTETLRAAALFGLTEAEVLDDGLSRDEPVSDVDPDEDLDEGVDPREQDAEQAPAHIATHPGDGKEAETIKRDHLDDDTDEDGERVDD